MRETPQARCSLDERFAIEERMLKKERRTKQRRETRAALLLETKELPFDL